MPKNYKDGTPHKKTRSCLVEGCGVRPRKMSGLMIHMKEHHGIEDVNAWWRADFERRYGFKPYTHSPFPKHKGK